MSNGVTAPRLYAFQAGGDLADLACYDPFDPNVGTKVFEPWFSYVIRHQQGNVLFDTGIHPDMTKDPRARLGEWADLIEMKVEEGEDIVSRLASIDLTPEDISIVVLSHMHFDHVDALNLFTHARIVVQRAEYAFAQRPAVYQAGTYLQSHFAGQYNWDLIDGPLDLFGDGVIELIPSPGHSPGHQSMLVSLTGDKLLLMADATYQLDKMEQRLLPAVVWSPDAMVASWALLEWLAKREGAEMHCSHDLEFRSRVRLAPEAWYE